MFDTNIYIKYIIFILITKFKTNEKRNYFWNIKQCYFQFKNAHDPQSKYFVPTSLSNACPIVQKVWKKNKHLEHFHLLSDAPKKCVHRGHIQPSFK